MTVEHRAAPGLDDIEIELADDGKATALRLRQVDAAETATEPETPERRILKALAEAETPISQRQIRERAATRHKTVGAVLKKLVREGRVRHDAEGHYRLVADRTENAPPAANGSRPGDARFPVPPIPRGSKRNRPPEPPPDPRSGASSGNPSSDRPITCPGSAKEPAPAKAGGGGGPPDTPTPFLLPATIVQSGKNARSGREIIRQIRPQTICETTPTRPGGPYPRPSSGRRPPENATTHISLPRHCGTCCSRTVYEPPLRLYEAEPASTMVAVLLPLIYHELIDGPAFQPWVQK